MNKYFVVSDIHGFYDELIEALNTAGYDRNNLNHTLIVAGDIFDRGPKPKEVYEFLKSIPKDRKILIKGNHEYMFLKLLNKDYPDIYDFSNKLVQTFCSLADFNVDTLEYEAFFSYLKYNSWLNVVKKIKTMEIVEWLKSDEWVNYYELDRFIFVHGFIPLQNKQNIPIYGNFNYDEYLTYSKGWRTSATKDEWYDSTWGCPWKQYKDGLFKSEEDNGKTLVCGHWHTSDFYKYLNKDFNDTSEIFYSSGIIAIDGGIYWKNGELYHPCNVLIIENNKCYNKYGEELKLRRKEN